VLRIQPIESAAQAVTYYAKSDGGYYMEETDLRREWVGRGAGMLGLQGSPEFDEFRRLIHGLDPHSGEQLTAKLVEHRISGWDICLNCPKKVTLAMEGGDERLHEAFWQAARETFADIEQQAMTRVRKGGRQEDRVAGNLVGYAVEHAETRPAKDDNREDPHRHLHIVVANICRDLVEGEWKALKFRSIMDNRKYLDRRFNQRFSAKVAALGYDIETKWDRNSKGSRRYVGWDIKGISDSVASKFSRRTGEIEKLAAELGITDAVSKDKLGATSRQNKRKDLTLGDLREYWDSRLTADEREQIGKTIADSAERGGRRIEPQAEQAMQYSVGHHFTRQAVVPLKTLEITAMERCMGNALPEDVEQTAARKNLLVRDGEATTKEALAEERRCIDFARDGRGTCRPLSDKAVPHEWKGLRFSDEQRAMIRHIWGSLDRVVLIRGAAGSGKTEADQAAVAGIEKPVVMLAPSIDASRHTLREKGFAEADTVAQFLINWSLQERAKDGVILIDEAAMLPIRELRQVFDFAGQLNARVILQGDPQQHQSVERGAIFDVLQKFAGLPVAELKEIWRQKHADYKRAVAAIDRGDVAGGFDILRDLGWIKQTGPFDRYGELVKEYFAGIDAGKSVLVIAPTHQEGDEITARIRERLKEGKIIGADDRTFPVLKPLHWTDAQKADLGNYSGTEVIQFHRNSGPFKAGQRIEARQLQADGYQLRPEHFSVYGTGEIGLAVGDAIRMTGSAKDESGKHKLDNGRAYSVAGFTPTGIRLNNGWVLKKDVGMISHDYVRTSYGGQGRTCDRVLIAMGRESAPAINAAAFYVAGSRARESCRIFTNISWPVLRNSVQRVEQRKSATELIGQPKTGRLRDKMKSFMREVHDKYRQLGEKARHALDAARDRQARQWEAEYAR
jgi:conjugative relaxase-like TrwC/TraI family protein